MKKQKYTHDSAFKSVFQDLDAVKEFIDNFLPHEIAVLINKDNLTPDSGTYLTKSLRQRFSDSVFVTTTKNKTIALALLFEHKYDKSGILPLQIFNYYSGIWDRDIKNGKPLTYIIPIVIYHGDEKEDYKPLYSYFKVKIEEFRPFIPDFKCLFLNLNQQDDKIFHHLTNNNALKGLFLMFKYINNTGLLIKNFPEIIKFASGNQKFRVQLDQLLLYLLNNSEINSDQIEIIADSLEDQEQKKIIMTGAKTFREVAEEKGIKKGIEKGIEKGRVILVRNAWKKGYSKHQIADFTDLPLNRIEELIAQFEKEAKNG